MGEPSLRPVVFATLRRPHLVSAEVGDLRMIWSGEQIEMKYWCTWESCRLQGKLWRVQRLHQGVAPHWNCCNPRDLVPFVCPFHLANLEPRVPFLLDEDLFARNVRSAKRGSAGGPTGMTAEHLHPLLDHSRDSQLFFQAAEFLARAQVPPSIQDAIRLGRFTVLSKPDGGVAGIVAGYCETFGCANDLSAVGRARPSRNSTLPVCVVDSGWVRVRGTCVARHHGDQCNRQQSHPLMGSALVILFPEGRAVCVDV